MFSRYCHEHALKATLARNKQNSKSQPPKTAEVLLHSLSHYVKKPKIHIASTSYSEDDHSVTEDNTQQKTTKYNDPFGNSQLIFISVNLLIIVSLQWI